MVAEVRIYFEGDPSLRRGFSEFFGNVARLARRPRMIAGRGTPVRDFMAGIHRNPSSVNVLLVDSEGPNDGNLATCIKSRKDWNRDIGSAVGDDQLHFMIQVMETWFLADRDAVRTYYGRQLREGRLPSNPAVEQIGKQDVIQGLEAATRATQKRTYHKTRHAPQLLAKLDAAKVRRAAPACDRLLRFLEQVLR